MPQTSDAAHDPTPQEYLVAIPKGATIRYFEHESVTTPILIDMSALRVAAEAPMPFVGIPIYDVPERNAHPFAGGAV